MISQQIQVPPGDACIHTCTHACVCAPVMLCMTCVCQCDYIPMLTLSLCHRRRSVGSWLRPRSYYHHSHSDHSHSNSNAIPDFPSPEESSAEVTVQQCDRDHAIANLILPTTVLNGAPNGLRLPCICDDDEFFFDVTELCGKKSWLGILLVKLIAVVVQLHV